MKDSTVVADITRAAVELFATQGYANTSVQQIVTAAGVTKGAMYHYFESKDDLLFGIYDGILSMQKQHLDEIVAAGGAGPGIATEVLRAVCIDVLETTIDRLEEGAVFFGSLTMLSAARQREVTRRRRVYHDAFATLIEQGRADGVFRDDVPTAVLIAHFFSDVHYLSHWYSRDGPEDATAVATQITELFLTSIQTQG